ncbi:MAG: substrate-binding domain-containing protein [Acidobacteria bacterium]|nr:substrate-binding domain-containing protein [Acidobacteriota bacterium]
MARLLATLLFMSTAATAAELKVLGIGALNPGFARISEQYKAEKGHSVTAQMDTATGMSKRLESGQTADVLIAPDTVIDEAARRDQVVISTKTLVARVGIGIAMRRGTAVPNVATVDALKQALLNADSIVYNQGSSGIYIDKLIEQMGIADRIKAKTTRYANAGQVLQHVMNGKANDIGFSPLPEIITGDPTRLQLAGPLPAPVQNNTSYAAVVMTGGNAGLAQDFIRYLTTPAAKQIFSAAGVD